MQEVSGSSTQGRQLPAGWNLGVVVVAAGVMRNRRSLHITSAREVEEER